MKKTILLITHETPVEQAVRSALDGFSIETAGAPEAAAEKLRQSKPALVILDHDLKQDEGLQLFRQLRLLAPATGFILLSQQNDIPTAVQAAKLGAADFLQKPAGAKALRLSVERNLAAAEGSALAAAGLPWLQGESPALKKMFEAIGGALLTRASLILVAERGIDKSDVADCIHRRSLKRKSRLRVIDLASFRREDLEGSFWATVQEAAGENQAADEEDRCGTLYLENIESLEESFRLSIFEFFKEKKPKLDPEVLIVIGLYDPHALPPALAKHYLQVPVPPLCERRGDLPLLVGRELAALSLRHGKNVNALSADLLYLLGLYDFPGNYHELSALLEIGVLAAGGEVIGLADLPLDFRTLLQAAVTAAHVKGELSLEAARRWLEKLAYKTLLAKTKSDPGAVARFLDLPRTALAERAAELGTDLLN
ncbi:MAG: sigma-54-dependent Fis family transcriptional regulator [Candidatus Saganbacteria bacterium]|nr:sigma-54-dependent Fis family transcriptional regulator [Candidatus Saganbacteria bacterium]